MKTQITLQQIQSASYKELIEICKIRKVKFTNQPATKLKELLKTEIKKCDSEQPKRSQNEHLKKEVHNIMRRKQFNKSDKMRALYDVGITKPAEIARITKCHYSFIYGVIKRYIN